MTTFLTPICMVCKHFRREAPGLTCEAFPEGIPDEIIQSAHDHRTPWDRDGGIQFEKTDSPSVSLSAILRDLGWEEEAGDG